MVCYLNKYVYNYLIFNKLIAVIIMFLNKFKSYFLKNKLLFIIMFLLLIFSSVYTILPDLPFWDEGVYVVNGKNLFSGGEIGVYENFRPPVMGLLLGFFWWIGLSPIVFGKIFIIICLLLLIYFTYTISEKLYKNSGIYSVLFLLVSYVFLIFTNKVLSGIPAALFCLISIYLFLEKKQLLSGIFLGLAFLTRFTSGLLLFIFGLILVIDLIKTKNFKKIIISFLKILIGFLILVIPYLIINKIVFGAFILPIINAQNVLLPSSFDLKTNGFIFYSWILLKQGLVFVFFIISLIFFFIKKRYRTLQYLTIILPAVLYFLYFSILPHFEERYIITLLPYFAIVSGIVLLEIIQSYFRKNLKYYRKLFFIILISIFIIIFLIVIADKIHVGIRDNAKEYYTFFKDKNDVGFIIINDPIFGIYYDGEFEYLSSPYYANRNLEFYPGRYKYITANKSFFDCSFKTENCETSIIEFKQKLETDYTLVYERYFYGDFHYIYKINN